jgi:diaminohydroxyphosphoribosylaminopyrimidine deaminase/5-amino-6-(5-phosphoribosylamino)uracil reductase
VAATGAEVVVLPPDPAGGVDLEALLGELGRRQIMSVLVEGGATLLGALFDAGLVDKVQAVIAPLIIGGAAPVAVAGHGATRMADALRLLDLSVDRLGEDVLVTGYPRPLPILPSEEMDSGVFDSAG